MPGHQKQAFLFGKALAHLLGKRRAARRHEHHMRPGAALGRHRLQNGGAAVVNGLRLHHHAGAAAIGVIVHLALLVQRVLAYLVGVKLDAAVFLRAANDALRHERLAYLREQGGNVNPHRHPPPRRRTCRGWAAR